MKETQMNSFLDRDQNLLALHSEFVQDSFVLVKVRNYGKGSIKTLVDITEFTRHRTSKARARKIACEQARKVGVVSMDYSVIRDDEIDRKVAMIGGTQTVVHVRQSCFAFDAG